MNGRVDIAKCVSGCENLLGNYKGKNYCQLEINGEMECPNQGNIVIKVMEMMGKRKSFSEHYKCINPKYLK